MGESERYQDYKDSKKKSAGAELLQNPLMALVVAHAVFFLALLIVQMFYMTTGSSPAEFEWNAVLHFRLPSSFNEFLHQPWSIITYLFTDTGATVWRLISNVLWMSAFGFFLLEQQEGEKVIPAYIYGALLSGIFFMIGRPFFSDITPLYFSGSQGAVMGLALASTMHHPSHRFFRHIGRGIPVWILLILFLFVDFSSVAALHPIYFISHIGGGMAGFTYIYLIKKGMDTGLWMHHFYRYCTNIFTPKFTSTKSEIRSRNFYNTSGRTPYKKEIKLNEDKLNEVLEKIHKKGFDSLSKEEKELLKKASESEDDV